MNRARQIGTVAITIASRVIGAAKAHVTKLLLFKAMDRVAPLPYALTLQAHLTQVKNLHQQNVQAGYGAVYLPDALERKYLNANREWDRQDVFPSRKRSVDPRSGVARRHHASRTRDTAAQRTAGLSSKRWRVGPGVKGDGSPFAQASKPA